MKKLLTPYSSEKLSLKNHLLMAPMTRCRAINNIPNELMSEYYEQRSGAGLIITEGTSPSPDGLGYCRIPGIFSQAQIEGWKEITTVVHKNMSKIFVQLMHTGRIAHADNLPSGAKVVGASNIIAAGQMYTDTQGMQDHSEPQALSTEGVYLVIEEYVNAAKNAMEAGFDGIELHGANGYLIEQFLNPNVNNRTDEFGGSIQNRSNFLLQIVREISKTIGNDKIGVRFSPFSTYNDLASYPENEVHETYSYLATELNTLGIAYIHISNNPGIPQRTHDAIRENFKGTIIMCNGLTPESGEQILQEGKYDLVGFGRPFISNPDLDKRIESNAPLNPVDFETLYTPFKEGYTDYPFVNGK
jgi:N-ethylmaleimide reductase